MHNEAPVVPDTTPAIHVTKDEIFDQVTVQVAHDVGPDHTKQTTEVTLVVQLAERYLLTKGDAIVHHVENEEVGPSVWIVSRSFPTDTILNGCSECPYREHAIQKDLRRVYRSVNRVMDKFVRHASKCVEKHVTRQASVNIPAIKAVQENLDHVIETMVSLSIVCFGEKLLVREVDIHKDTSKDDEL